MARPERKRPGKHPRRRQPGKSSTTSTEQPAPRRQWLVGGVLAVAVLGVAIAVAWNLLSNHSQAQPHVSNLRLEDIPFDGNQAFRYLEELCDIGPRPSGSPRMRQQQQYLVNHFTELADEVELQRFRVPHPADESPVEMANIIVRWHPQRKQRVMLCAHYDTLPYPMLDPKNPRGRFVGANDNAGGVALLMELGKRVGDMDVDFGIDFVFFDGEEFIFSRWDKYFWGSEYFARQYAQPGRDWEYRAAVLLDMISDADLQIYYERNSLSWADSRWIAKDIWATAARLQVREFIPRRKHLVQDDHVPLHNIGGIPAIDVIDFDYPPWHTERDVPENCSPLSLAKVGWVVEEWLAALQLPPRRPRG